LPRLDPSQKIITCLRFAGDGVTLLLESNDMIFVN
jgi:hypothetical protein